MVIASSEGGSILYCVDKLGRCRLPVWKTRSVELYTHTHTHIHTHTHTYTHIHTHAHTHVELYTHTHTHTHIHTHTYIHIHTHTFWVVVFVHDGEEPYGVATVSRIDKIIAFFCRI